MAMNPSHDALSACDEIEELLRDSVPGADAQKLARIRFLCARLVGSTNIRTKADRLASRASIYFSARRHQTETGGAEGVMREMRYSLLGSIREQLQWLQRGDA